MYPDRPHVYAGVIYAHSALHAIHQSCQDTCIITPAAICDRCIRPSCHDTVIRPLCHDTCIHPPYQDTCIGPPCQDTCMAHHVRIHAWPTMSGYMHGPPCQDTCMAHHVRIHAWPTMSGYMHTPIVSGYINNMHRPTMSLLSGYMYMFP